MGYIEPTKEIEIMFKKVNRFRARNPREDRGDGFRDGTPDEIIEMNNKVHKYYEENDDGCM